MQHQKDPAQAALTAIREIRQRIEGFVPFEQAEYIADLFDAALESVQSMAKPSAAQARGVAPPRDDLEWIPVVFNRIPSGPAR